MIFLRKPHKQDLEEVRSAYANSRSIHHPWVYAPDDVEAHLREEGRYFVCLAETGQILGTFNISGVIRGYFQSAYLGYAAFYPYQGMGYMKQGMTLLLREAFEGLNLHRLEANIQPGNAASIRLVSGAGFVKEGFSRQYLRVGGVEWMDHERWAMVNPHWKEIE